MILEALILTHYQHGTDEPVAMSRSSIVKLETCETKISVRIEFRIGGYDSNSNQIGG